MGWKLTTKKLLANTVGNLMPKPERPLCVLMYHSVGSYGGASISTSVFRSHMECIHNKLGAPGFFDWKSGLSTLDGRPAVLLTFDDGYRDNHEFAAPVLREFNAKAIFFITTGFIEKELDITKGFKSYKGLSPMTWKDIESLVREGHTVGLHGHTHANFRGLSFDGALNELERSLYIFKTRIGISPTVFAYPFGQLQHQRDDLDGSLASLRIEAVFTTENRISDITKLTHGGRIPMCIPRIRVDADDNEYVLSQKISGQWDYVAYVQRLRACLRHGSLRQLHSR